MRERYLIFAEDVKRRVKGLDNQRLLLRVSRTIMPESSALSTGLWFRHAVRPQLDNATPPDGLQFEISMANHHRSVTSRLSNLHASALGNGPGLRSHHVILCRCWQVYRDRPCLRRLPYAPNVEWVES